MRYLESKPKTRRSVRLAMLQDKGYDDERNIAADEEDNELAQSAACLGLGNTASGHCNPSA